MKTAHLLALALALGAVAAPAAGQSNRTVYSAGNWFVVRSTQPTTGTVACTGFYKGQPGVQLSTDSLIIKVPGELKSVVLRFGEEPARAARSPDKTELQIGAVMLAGADLEHLRRSTTLGLDITTVQGRNDHTLALEGLDESLKNIRSGCPLPAATERAEHARQLAREKAQAARCSPAGIARMRERGLNDLRIKSACPRAELTPR